MVGRAQVGIDIFSLNLQRFLVGMTNGLGIILDDQTGMKKATFHTIHKRKEKKLLLTYPIHF